MNIDKLLSIHQSHSLMKIGAINKQILIAQYAQCEQISALQKQIAVSTNISRQILENQLKEIKHKELQRYYKSLAYAMNEATQYIETEDDVIFKCFLYELYSKPIIENTLEAKNNLEEITDKEYCEKIRIRIQAIESIYSSSQHIYTESEFSRLLSAQTIYTEQQKTTELKRRIFYIEKINIEKRLSEINPLPLKNTFRGCGIKVFLILSIFGGLLMLLSIFTDITVLPALFILFFLPFFVPLIILSKKDKKWKKNYNQHIYDTELKKKDLIEELNSLQNEMNEEESLLKTAQYIQIKNAITLSYPHWEETIIKIDSYIPKIETSESQNNRFYNKLYDVAKLAINTQKISTSMIQRYYSCGYIEAEKYFNKLQELNIVKNNKVKIYSEEELNTYWEIIKDSMK